MKQKSFPIICGAIILIFAVLLFYQKQKEDSFGALTVLKVSQGGTGVATFSSGECLVGNGTSAITTQACSSGGGGGGYLLYNNTKNMYYVGTTTADWLIGASSTTTTARLEVIGNGNFSGSVGIGTTSPYTKLSVVGETVAQNFTATTTYATSTLTGEVYLGGTSGVRVVPPMTWGATKVSIGGQSISSASPILQVKGEIWAFDTGNLRFLFGESTSYYGGMQWTDATNILSIGNSGYSLSTIVLPSTGNVGIGTTSPYAKLSVSGHTAFEYFTATSTTATSTINGYLSINSAGRLLIPNATDPTISMSGQIGVNTTVASTSIRYFDGTAERSLSPTKDKSMVLASSTLRYMGAFGASGTTTILVSNSYRPFTLVSFFCKTDQGTAYIGFGDGSATTTEANCSTGGVEVNPSANNAWVMRENMFLEAGYITGTPHRITVTATIREDAD